MTTQEAWERIESHQVLRSMQQLGPDKAECVRLIQECVNDALERAAKTVEVSCEGVVVVECVTAIRALKEAPQ